MSIFRSTQKKDLPPHEHSWLSPPKAQHLGQYSVCSHCKTFNLLTSSPIPAKILIINSLSNSSSRASGVGTIHDLFNICFAVGKTFYVCIAGFRIISNPQMTKLEVISRWNADTHPCKKLVLHIWQFSIYSVWYDRLKY